MNDETRLRLLKIIKFDGNVQPLIELGFDFVDVVKLIKSEVTLGNAIYNKGHIKISDEGIIEIGKLEKKIGRKFPWIEPDIQSKIQPLGEGEIYIPNRQSIRFLFD
jgi:hypothetical protein